MVKAMRRWGDDIATIAPDIDTGTKLAGGTTNALRVAKVLVLPTRRRSRSLRFGQTTEPVPKSVQSLQAVLVALQIEVDDDDAGGFAGGNPNARLGVLSPPAFDRVHVRGRILEPVRRESGDRMLALVFAVGIATGAIFTFTTPQREDWTAPPRIS